MIFDLSYDEKRYEFSLIEDTIRKYYPIGIEDNDRWNHYLAFSGTKEIEKLVVENIHNSKNYKEKWVNFTNSIKREYGGKVNGMTFGQSPSFSATLVIDFFRLKNYTISKSLYFTVSLIGPFYTIFGLDEASFIDGRPTYSSIVAITVSPFKEYENDFLFLKKKIEERFKDYKYVPFNVYTSKVDGLKVLQVEDHHVALVYNALFDGKITSTVLYSGHNVRGDEHYGYEEWKLKPVPTTEDYEIMKLLEQNSSKTIEKANETTLHKVWKYKSYNIISGPVGFFEMDAFDLLDLTNEENVITKTKEEIPVVTKFFREGNCLYIGEKDENFFYKISVLTHDELKLAVCYKIGSGDKKIDASFMELVFESYR